MSFVTRERGWSVGSVGPTLNGQSAFAHTVDGGATWSVRALGTALRRTPGALRDIRFRDDRHGTAIATHDVFVTVDGGMTWRAASVGVRARSRPSRWMPAAPCGSTRTRAGGTSCTGSDANARQRRKRGRGDGSRHRPAYGQTAATGESLLRNDLPLDRLVDYRSVHQFDAPPYAVRPAVQMRRCIRAHDDRTVL